MKRILVSKCAASNSTCYRYTAAAAAALALVVKVDLFITETEPFRMAKDEAKVGLYRF
jgi:hypothetical protein